MICTVNRVTCRDEPRVDYNPLSCHQPCFQLQPAALINPQYTTLFKFK